MEHSYDIDWMAAYYGNFELGDSTINFWLTATFAVIVAVHALGANVTKNLTRLIASLYALFSVYTWIRYLYLVDQFEFVSNRVQELANSETFGCGETCFVLDSVIEMLFLGGSLATVIFVLLASRRTKTKNDT